MNANKLSTKLRELADQIDAIGAVGDEVDAAVRVGFYRVNTREDLVRLIPLVVRPRLLDSIPAIVGTSGGCDVSLHYTAGLLGGERREVFTDTQAGLDALVAESKQEAAAV
jgi:hypothetical protein